MRDVSYWICVLRYFKHVGLILWAKDNRRRRVLLPYRMEPWKVWEAKWRKMDTGKVSACVKSQQNVMLTQLTWGARQRCARVIRLHCTQPLPRQMVRIQVPNQLITRKHVLITTCCRPREAAWNSLRMENLSWNYLIAGMERRLHGFPCQRKLFGHPLALFRIARRVLLPLVVSLEGNDNTCYV